MSLCKLAGVKLEGDRQSPALQPRHDGIEYPQHLPLRNVIGGTQDKYEVFIENGHAHVERIVAHLTGKHTAVPEVVYANPES